MPSNCKKVISKSSKNNFSPSVCVKKPLEKTTTRPNGVRKSKKPSTTASSRKRCLLSFVEESGDEGEMPNVFPQSDGEDETLYNLMEEDDSMNAGFSSPLETVNASINTPNTPEKAKKARKPRKYDNIQPTCAQVNPNDSTNNHYVLYDGQVLHKANVPKGTRALGHGTHFPLKPKRDFYLLSDNENLEMGHPVLNSPNPNLIKFWIKLNSGSWTEHEFFGPQHWNREDWISDLKKWRHQVFRRAFSDQLKERKLIKAKPNWTMKEKDFARERILEVVAASQAPPTAEDFAKIIKELNEKFEGTQVSNKELLANGKGVTKSFVLGTRTQLHAQYNKWEDVKAEVTELIDKSHGQYRVKGPDPAMAAKKPLHLQRLPGKQSLIQGEILMRLPTKRSVMK